MSSVVKYLRLNDSRVAEIERLTFKILLLRVRLVLRAWVLDIILGNTSS